MDNRITRRRLSNFLSYEWILMIIMSVVGIIVWSLIFTMTGVKLTTGQEFKFYFDETIDANSVSELYALFKDEENENKSVFSYDILKMGHERLISEYNVLKDRMSVHEGDAIITDITVPADDAKDKSVRAKTIVDNYLTYDFISLEEDAEKYLSQFLKDGLTADSVDVTDFFNLDGAKIEKVFRERLAKDNRFRSESQKQEGIALEKQRIESLCKEVKKFRHLLNQGEEYFFMYTRYEQLLEQGINEDYRDFYEQDILLKGRRPYGLKLEALSGGENSPSKFFRKVGADDAKDVVLLVFNFTEYQPHLQFESIAFINAIVDGCSNLYNGI